jgi:hypothetical protein
LVRVGGKALDDIYSCCRGYPGHGGLARYLRRHARGYAAWYVGTVGRSLRTIRDEDELRKEIQNYLDRPSTRPILSESAQRIWEAVKTHIKTTPYAWACEKRPSRETAWGCFTVPLLIAILAVLAWVVPLPWWVLPAVALALLLLAVVLVVLLAVIVIKAEKRDLVVDPIKAQGQHVGKLVQKEDQIVQNQLSHLVNIKPGWYRPLALWVVLTTVNLLARYKYVHGSLGGIPTIHFARWVIIDDRRRLLFFSNYDGSWENYLGDFIDKAAPGLTAVWSNTEGCPKAEWVYKAGARDEQRFKSWTRDHQIVTQVWYSAYPELTVDNINNNSAIRAGLFGDLNEKQARAWLERL